MSCSVQLDPIISVWGVLAEAVAATAQQQGWHVVKGKVVGHLKASSKRRVELDVEAAQDVEATLRADDELKIEKDGVTVVFGRDARGRFSAHVEGDKPEAELRAIGEELSGKVVQQYVYRRLSEELAKSGFTTVSEDVGPDEAIRLHLRRFEG